MAPFLPFTVTLNVGWLWITFFTAHMSAARRMASWYFAGTDSGSSMRRSTPLTVPWGSNRKPWLEDLGCDGALPPLDADSIKVAGLTFPKRTGLGVDAVNPRAYGQASPECRQEVAELLMRAEASLEWPRQLQLLIYCMLAKPEGGVRGIAKLPSLFRLWERARYPLLEEWYAGGLPQLRLGAFWRHGGGGGVGAALGG